MSNVAITAMANLIQALLDGMIVNVYSSRREPVDAAWTALVRLLGLEATPLARQDYAA